MTHPVTHYVTPSVANQDTVWQLQAPAVCQRRRGRNWAATTDPKNVTCKRCRQVLSDQRNHDVR